MFGQLVFSSIAILEIGLSESWRLARRDWIAEIMQSREAGSEAVMLIMNGLDDVGSFRIIVWIQSR